MSKFNSKQSTVSSTYAGGMGTPKMLEEAWLNMVFSSFLEGQFYEESGTQQDRFVNLTDAMIKAYGIEFVMKAGIFARQEIGMRSASHLTAAVVNGYQAPGKREFFRRVCRRPDDVSEIFAAVDAIGGKRSHALVRGCADFLSGCSAYQIGKYKMSGKKYNMYDIINLTHASSDAISAYKDGTLPPPETWEVCISGKSDTYERYAEWRRLVEERKLGYLALIRNINNIVEAASNLGPKYSAQWLVEHLAPQIKDEDAVHGSKVFPYQIYSAFKNMKIKNTHVVCALEDAFTASIGNMPDLDGSTCIIMDVSGSMEQLMSENSLVRIKDACAVYAYAVLRSCEDCDVIHFGDYGKMCDKDSVRTEPPFKAIELLAKNPHVGCGTKLRYAIGLVKKHYDRVFIFSDQQCCSGSYVGPVMRTESCVRDMVKQYGIKHVYSFDLGNYPVKCTPSIPECKYITSLGDSVFKFIELNEISGSLKEYIEEKVTL